LTKPLIEKKENAENQSTDLIGRALLTLLVKQRNVKAEKPIAIF
jgi:hypothetical protein